MREEGKAASLILLEFLTKHCGFGAHRLVTISRSSTRVNEVGVKTIPTTNIVYCSFRQTFATFISVDKANEYDQHGNKTTSRLIGKYATNFTRYSAE